jgi:UDP-glucose 4-epimerase
MKAIVTGGAGFIGSHLTDALIARGDDVVVIDDLSNGRAENLNERATFVDADVNDVDATAPAYEGAAIVFHQAALGSVKRSVDAPLATDHANAHGTLTVLERARAAGVPRVVAASSSSVYGGVAPLPTNEDHPTAPKSPYAVSKITAELYCRVYAQLMGLETVCLRYFNVFGPRQRSDSAYAAAIPLFVHALSTGEPPVVNGDGQQTRDFTFVDDVVRANLLAADASAERCSGRVFNIGGGQRHSVLDLLESLGRILGVDPQPVHGEARPGDARDSQADISAARAELGWAPEVSFEEGLRRVCEAASAQRMMEPSAET